MIHRAPRPQALIPLTLVALLGVSPLALSKGKEQEPPPITDQVEVEVVNIEVTVTGKNGVPVRGLTANDFEIYEDGKLKPVSNFFAFVDGEAAQAGEAEETQEDSFPDPKLRKRMALLFDNNTLDKRKRDEALDDLERFILEQFEGDYEWAVVGYGDELQYLLPFTADKTRVLGALGRIKNLPVAVKQQRASSQLVSDDPITRIDRSGLVQGAGTGSQRGQGVISLRDFEIRQRTLDSLQQLDKTIGAAVELMQAYAALPGRKSLVLLSGVLEALPNSEQVLGRAFPGAGGGDGRVDPLILSLAADLDKRYEAIVKTANASGFAIYPVATLGFHASPAPHHDIERREAPVGGFDSPSTGIDGESTPRILAHGTGGKFFTSSVYYQVYDLIDDRTSNSYVLGYTTDHLPEGKYHRLEVKLKGKSQDGTVDYRQGYLHLSTEDQLMQMLSSPLTFPKDQGDFEVQVAASTPELMGKGKGKTYSTQVAGVMPLNRVTLVPQGKEAAGRVHMYLAIYNQDGRLVDLIRKYQDIRLPTAALTQVPENQPAKFGFVVNDLEPGAYTFALTLMDEVTTDFGTGSAHVLF